MGIGDEIMAAGHARTAFRDTGKRVHICDLAGRPRWNDMWHGLDWIAKPHEKGDFAKIRNGSACRPYCQYPWGGGQQKFTAWRARDHIGGILFTEAEITFAQHVAAAHPGFVVVEPNLKPKSNPNKDWGFDRWQQLVDLMPDVRWLQIGEAKSRRLNGVAFVETGTFRLAAAVLSKSRMAVVPEGAMQHALAHMGRKAVVLFGSVVPVETLGYPWLDNITGEGDPCGNWQDCPHCSKVWASITPEMVKARVEAQMRNGTDRGACRHIQLKEP